MATPAIVNENEMAVVTTTGINAVVSSAVAGNYCILAGKFLSTTAITAAGFTQVTGSPFNGGTSRQIFIAYRKIQSGDIVGGTATYALDDTSATSKYLEVYQASGLDPTTPNLVAVQTPRLTAVTSNPLITTGTLSQAKCLVIAVCEQAAGNGGSTSVNSGFTLDTSATLLSTLVASKITTVNTALAPTFSWLTARDSIGLQAVFLAAPDTSPGTFGDSLLYSLNRMAHTIVNGVPTLAESGAANAYAGTVGLETVGALNVAAGNTVPNYKSLEGVLNQLAGTTNLGADEAASRILA